MTGIGLSRSISSKAPAESCVRDLFGFSLAGLTPAEQKARGQSQTQARSQVKAWVRKIKAPNALDLYTAKRELKPLVRKGLPPEIRPEIWMLLSGAKLRKAAAPHGYYTSLVASNGQGNYGIEVSREVTRAFRQHHEFRDSDGFGAVRRVLGAFTRHNPQAGLVSGMAAVAGFLLTVMGFHREEDAFWVFVSLVEEILLKMAPDQLRFWCKAQERVLGVLAAEKVSRVHQQFMKLGCTASAVAKTWFSSLFVLALPAETVARIWDCLFCEGPKVLQRVGLALLKKCETTVLMTTDVQQLSQIVQYKLRRVFDTNELFASAFNRLGTMKSAQIVVIQHEVEADLERELEERARRLDYLMESMDSVTYGP